VKFVPEEVADAFENEGLREDAFQIEELVEEVSFHISSMMRICVRC
jgi:hypothetical protein